MSKVRGQVPDPPLTVPRLIEGNHHREQTAQPDVPADALDDPLAGGTSTPPARVEDLEAQIAGLQIALKSRELTGTATGLIAAWLQVPAGQAWQIIVKVSSTTNIRACEVARLLVTSTNGPLVDPDDQVALHRIADALLAAYYAVLYPAINPVPRRLAKRRKHPTARGAGTRLARIPHRRFDQSTVNASKGVDEQQEWL